ncbi:MAG: hypothetical protein AB7S78_14100 [Candidatus Omnitrophota bacterium]
MPNTTKIELTHVEKYPETCPVCSASGKGFVFHDGDNLEPDKPIGRGDYSDYNAVLSTGECKTCKGEVFEVEIVIPSSPVPGSEFIDDNNFTNEGYLIYQAKLESLEWCIYHYRNVVYERDQNIVHEWMDKHFIGPFRPNPLNPVARAVYPDPSPGLSELEIAKLILEKLGPKLLALKWP